MTDVKRWVDDGASEPVRALLEAARDERPGEAGVQRTLVAIGVGSAVATGASHAAGSAGAASLAKGATGVSSLALVSKWAAIGAIGAATTFGAVRVATHAFEPAAPADVSSPPTVATSRQVAPERTAPGTARLAEPAPPSEPEAEPTVEATRALAASPKVLPNAAPDRSPKAMAGDGAASSERILEEVRAIDRARSALGRGDGRATLDALDGYRNGFAERRFEPEALYLRMEALVVLGDQAGAKAAAERLLATFPNAPQAARARVVAGR